MDSNIIGNLIQIIAGVIIVPYLIYNHRRIDRVIEDQAVIKSKVDDIKDDIKEIKAGVNKLIDRELNKRR